MPSSSLETNYIGKQNISKEIINNPWLTSGHLGSRDCVLVFRTSVFNMQNVDDDDDEEDEDNNDDVNIVNNDIPNINTNENEIPSTSSLFTKKSLIRSENINSNNINKNVNNNNSNNKDSNNKNTIINASLPKSIKSNNEPNKKLNSSSSPNNNKLANLKSIKSTTNNASKPMDKKELDLCDSTSSNESNGDFPKTKNNNNVSSATKNTSQSKNFMKNMSSEKYEFGHKKNIFDNKMAQNDKESELKSNDDKNEINISNTVNNTSHSNTNRINNLCDDKENFKKTSNKKSSNRNDDGFNISEMPAAKLDIKFKFMNTDTKLLRKIFINHGLVESEDDKQFNILWTGVHIKPDILRNLTPYQRVNHFPRSYELTRKDRLYKNIENMQYIHGFKHFDIVPQSFLLPNEYRNLITAHNKYKGPWIIKPAASSRGRGIYIVNSPDQIQTDEQVLVSKYIINPLCIDGNKCDLRVYVAVTSFDPLVIYMYKEGLVRLAAVKYDKNIETLWNPCMHLCNYSVNKYHSDYIKSNAAVEENVGHKWTLSALLRHLKSRGCDIKQLMFNIEDLIIKSMFACAQSIISACRMFVPTGNNCFELYGFDILIDENLKPWLLEINLSPSLGIDSPLDVRVKASLITDLLTLIGVPAYSPAVRLQYDTRWTRFRGCIGSRRANSADHINIFSTGSNGKKIQSTRSLSSEEVKIIKNAKLQYERRGGFVRIFPNNESMQRYSSFLDPVTGIPISMNSSNGSSSSTTFTMILPHNFNELLYNQLFSCDGNNKENGKFIETLDDRMEQYERVLETTEVNIGNKKTTMKSIEEGKRLRRNMCRLIESGNEFTQFQARKAFGRYLECVLHRLCEEPRSYHEKLILKFINRISDNYRTPLLCRNPLNIQASIGSKDHTAMIAKLLSDFLQIYHRDTEAYVDTFDSYGMISTKTFNEFLSQAQENDLETVLTLHTNITKSVPFLNNRFGSSNMSQPPPIPNGIYGLLKALPNMIPTVSYSREQAKVSPYCKNLDLSLIKNNTNLLSSTSSSSSSSSSSVSVPGSRSATGETTTIITTLTTETSTTTVTIDKPSMKIKLINSIIKK